MKEIGNSMAEALEDRGFNKISDDPGVPALSEAEHLQELCIVASYLSETLSYYISKNDLAPGTEHVQTNNVPDKS